MYHYPFKDFVRDLEATRQPLKNGTQRDFFVDAREVIDYMKENYSNEIDQIERASAISVTSSYISRNMPLFDQGKLAVKGRNSSLVSDHLLRAVHWLVLPVAFSEKEKAPEPTKVIQLAQSFLEHSEDEIKFQQDDGGNG